MLYKLRLTAQDLVLDYCEKNSLEGFNTSLARPQTKRHPQIILNDRTFAGRNGQEFTFVAQFI